MQPALHSNVMIAKLLWLTQRRDLVMGTLSIEDTEYVFADDLSDEALEIAAGTANGVPVGTSANCTATVIWSTFCPNG
jgi:hypothetical protein